MLTNGWIKDNVSKTVTSYHTTQLIAKVFMRREILQWLFSASLSGKHNAIRAKRVRNTGQWLLQDTRFKSWVSGTSVQLLFCMGIGIAYRQK